MNKKKVLLIGCTLIILGTLVFGAVAGGIYWYTNRDKEEIVKDDEDIEDDGRVINSNYYQFGEYKLEDINITPSVQDYTIDPNLSNVYIYEGDSRYEVLRSELTNQLKSELAEDQFIILEGDNKEFFSVYENNRYSYVPNFITTDALLHTYHLIFDSTLKELEMEVLSKNASELAANMVEKATDQYSQAGDTEMQIAAKRNIAFFSVAARLFDETFEIPEIVLDVVEEELALIAEHGKIEVSPVMSIGIENPDPTENVMEDYTQYIPRGHYTKNETLKSYFNGMMYFGRMTFLAKDISPTLSALLITDVLDSDQEIFNLWDSIYAPTNFFVGKSDDLTFYEYKTVFDEIAPDTDVLELTNEQRIAIHEEIKKLRPPEINSIPIFDETIQQDRDEVITGFRFMGQRFTVDAKIFQNLIYRSVKESSEGKRKMFPTSVEVPAAMGDDTAIEILKEDTDAYDYPNYSDQMSYLRSYIESLDLSSWTQNLYWGWMYTLNGFVGDTATGYPGFMQTEKWQKKELNTYVASWTELKHDTILYSKQVYAELGAGGWDEELPDDRGYVEPNIEVWRRLLALVQMTTDGLLERELITETNLVDSNNITCSYEQDVKERAYCNLVHMEDSVTRLLEISKKELQEETLTEEEYDFIRYLGGDLEDMFMATLDPASDRWAAVDDNPAMLVADVATDPNGGVLEEGTGYINEIYVVVPVEGELRVAKGAVYSQYEFKVPLDQRMTNEGWREMLEEGNAPDLLPWQESLISR